MGINVQVCWEKFCRYWEVEPRFVPMEGDRFCLNAEEALKLVDENTIGIVVIMGSTFDGRYENVKEVNDALVNLNKKTGYEVPIHVDAASGGFIAPFYSLTLNGIFACHWSNQSTVQDTNMVWFILAWAGSFGGTKISCRRI